MHKQPENAQDNLRYAPQIPDCTGDNTKALRKRD